MNKPKFSKRLGSAIFNFFVFLFLAVCIDYFVMPKTYKSALKYNEISQQIDDKNKEFESLQDEYGIYIYDENNKRIENKNVSEQDANDFLNNQEVQKLKAEIPECHKKIVLIDISSFLICYFISAFGINIVFSFIFKKGNSFGGIVFGVRYKYDDGEEVNSKTVILYDLLSFAFHYVLSIFTLGILPAILLYQIYYNEKSQSLIEKWLNIQYFER